MMISKTLAPSEPRSASALVRLQPELLERIGLALPPRDMERLSSTCKSLREVLTRPGYMTSYIEDAARRCPLTVDTIGLDCPVPRRAALRTLHQVQSVPPRDAWRTPGVTTQVVEPPYVHISCGPGAFHYGSHYLGLSREGRMAVGICMSVDTKPPPGLDHFSQNYSWSGSPGGLVEWGHGVYRNKVDSTLIETPPGWRALIHTVGHHGILLGCWPSGRVRAWSVDARDLNGTQRQPFDATVAPLSRHALELDGNVAAVIERSESGTVSLTTFELCAA